MGRRTVTFQPVKEKKSNVVPAGVSFAKKTSNPKPKPTRILMTPYSGIIQKYINEDKNAGRRDGHSNHKGRHRDPIFGTSSIFDAGLPLGLPHHPNQKQQQDDNDDDDSSITADEDEGELPIELTWLWSRYKVTLQRILRLLVIIVAAASSKFIYKKCVVPRIHNYKQRTTSNDNSAIRPAFVYDHPYVTSSYYTGTSNIKVLEKTLEFQIEPKKDRLPDRERGIVSRLAILRPFCEFDAEPLPTTFACWNSLVPCRAAEGDLGDIEEDDDVDEWVLFDMSVNGNGRRLEKEEEDNWECEADYTDTNTSWSFRGIANSLFKRCKHKSNTKDYFDEVPADGLRTTSADLFLFYSQELSENKVAMEAVDKIMMEFFSPGGWSRCFDNIYAVEANIPKELDLYIPAAQEELYNWVNGPNRQYEAGFRIIQSPLTCKIM